MEEKDLKQGSVSSEEKSVRATEESNQDTPAEEIRDKNGLTKAERIARRKKKQRRLSIMQALFCLIAVVCLLYPMFGNYIINRDNAEIIATYVEEKGDENVEYMEEVQKELEGDAFNSGGDVFENLAIKEGISKQGEGARVIGSVEVPKIGIELPVYDRVDSEVLSKGAGIVNSTDMPLGRVDHLSVISAHSGTSMSDYFKYINKLDNGDIFKVNNGVEEMYYRVYDRVEVLPTESEVLARVPGKDVVALLTCTSVDGLNSHRLIIYGERDKSITPDSGVEKLQTKAVIPQIRFKIMAGIGIAIILIIPFVIIKDRKKAKESEE